MCAVHITRDTTWNEFFYGAFISKYKWWHCTAIVANNVAQVGVGLRFSFFYFGEILNVEQFA